MTETVVSLITGAFLILGIWANEQVAGTRRRAKRDLLHSDIDILRSAPEGIDTEQLHRKIEERIRTLGDDERNDGPSWLLRISIAVLIALIAGFVATPFVASIAEGKNLAAEAHPDRPAALHWTQSVLMRVKSFGDDPWCSELSEVERSPRGAILGEIGQPTGPLLFGDCDPYFKLTLNGMQQLAHCHLDPSAPPIVASKFLRLDFSIELSEKPLESDNFLAREAFYSVSDTGELLTSIGGADICDPAASPEGVTDPIPGQTYTISIVAQVPEGNGYVGLRWKGRGWDGSWEFPY